MREAHSCIRCGKRQGSGTFGEGKSNSERLRHICGQPASRAFTRSFFRSGAIATANGRIAATIGAKGRITMREASGRGLKRAGSSVTGGFCAHVRFRDSPVDARPSSRSSRGNSNEENERSHEVVPRNFRDNIRDFPIFRFAFDDDEFHQDGAVGTVSHQCGMRGVRVGEAQNPGPSQRKPFRSMHGRDVASRTSSEFGTLLDSDSNAPLSTRIGPRALQENPQTDVPQPAFLRSRARRVCAPDNSVEETVGAIDSHEAPLVGSNPSNVAIMDATERHVPHTVGIWRKFLNPICRSRVCVDVRMHARNRHACIFVQPIHSMQHANSMKFPTVPTNLEVLFLTQRIFSLRMRTQDPTPKVECGVGAPCNPHPTRRTLILSPHNEDGY